MCIGKDLTDCTCIVQYTPQTWHERYLTLASEVRRGWNELYPYVIRYPRSHNVRKPAGTLCTRLDASMSQQA